jgi:hypothetical protein
MLAHYQMCRYHPCSACPGRKSNFLGCEEADLPLRELYNDVWNDIVHIMLLGASTFLVVQDVQSE